ncbi:MAG: hypothetical protein CK427_15110 [Leptospira sp.]|nr:MAG: hypothetical protein CK427_15110 [Leptospira sp.]
MKSFWNNSKIQWGFSLTICLALLTLTTCKKDKDEDDANFLLLGYLYSSGQANAAATKAAGQVRGATAGVASAVSTAASNNNVAFNGINTKSKHQLMASLHQKVSKFALDKKINNLVIPTALSKVGGGTCNNSGCSATLSGSANCISGNANSGTFTTSNLQVAFSFSGSGGGLGYSGTMKGDLKLDKCQTLTADYFNFPSFTASISNGDINYDGTNTVRFENLVSSGTGLSADLTVKETSTTKSSNLSINGGQAQSVNIVSALDLTVKTVSSNVTTSATATEYNFKATYNDTLTGKVAVTGSVGGGSVNVSRTYNGDKFTYDVNCKITFVGNSGIGAGDCTITNK